jgi:hypothetical protein
MSYAEAVDYYSTAREALVMIGVCWELDMFVLVV